jgi:hypothetical protein
MSEMSEVVEVVAALACAGCSEPIECCELCDETECPAAICYECTTHALGERMPQPHAHGG